MSQKTSPSKPAYKIVPITKLNWIGKSVVPVFTHQYFSMLTPEKPKKIQNL